MRWSWSPGQAVQTGRYALLAMMLGIWASTSLGVGLEIVCYVIFAADPELRRRVWNILRSPLCLGLLLFGLAIVLGALHGAPLNERLAALVPWRRLFLFVLAAAVFDDEPSKCLLLRVYLLACALIVTASFLTYFLRIDFLSFTHQAVVHNYVTQGMILSIAAAICVAVLARPQPFAHDRILGSRLFVGAMLALTVANLDFVLIGRSGYLALFAMLVTLGAWFAKGSWRAKLLGGLVVAVGLALLLAGSSKVRDRIAVGIEQAENAETSPEETSLGYRVVFLRTTLRMLRDDPIWGVGTGNFQGAYAQYVNKSDRWQDTVTGDPHNQFLKIWVEQGIFGLAAFLFFIGHALTRPGRSPYRELAAAVLVGWCATSLFSAHFSTFAEGRMIFFWLGAMLAWNDAGGPGTAGASARGELPLAADAGGLARQSGALSSSALNSWIDWSRVPSFR